MKDFKILMWRSNMNNPQNKRVFECVLENGMTFELKADSKDNAIWAVTMMEEITSSMVKKIKSITDSNEIDLNEFFECQFNCDAETFLQIIN